MSLSADQAKLAKEAWDMVVAKGQVDVATKAFAAFFAKQPGSHSLFPFAGGKDAAGVMADGAWAGQAGKVCKAIGDAASKMDAGALKSLGAKHVGFKVSKDMLDAMGPCLIDAIGAALGGSFTANHKAAMGAFYGALTSNLKAGM